MNGDDEAATEPGSDDGWTPTVLDALCSPDLVAEWAAQAGPGSRTVSLLAVMRPEAMSYGALIDASDALEQAKAWLEARQHRLHAALAQRPVPGAREQHKDWGREELALALRVPFGVAADRLLLAEQLAARFPATLELLEQGKVSPQHARALAELTAKLDDRTAAKVEARVLPRAPEQHLTLFKRSVTLAATALDPAGAEQRRRRAEADRCVRIRPADDAMASMWGLLRAEDAVMVDTALTALAKELAQAKPGDDRTVQQRRADALVALCADRLTGSDSFGCQSTEQGLAPRVQVTVSLSTLLAMDELPGELDGYGPVPADVARRLAADPTGTWRRLVTDPLGTLRDCGARSYRPPADLARYVIARDARCRFPGCTRMARNCDLDHVVAFGAGGPTAADNIESLCPRHHKAKHEGGWRVSGNPDDELRWTSPAGKSYTSRPAAHPIDHSAGHLRDRAAGPPLTSDPADPDPPPF